MYQTIYSPIRNSKKLVETSDDWIMTRTGIKERHILKGENKGTSHMMEIAIKELLAKTIQTL